MQKANKAGFDGYGFARLEFPFRRTLFVIVLLGLAVPEQAVILPRHQLFAWAGLHNSYPGLILPSLTGSFGVFFMTQYFRAIPRDLDEAALLLGRPIDGIDTLDTAARDLLDPEIANDPGVYPPAEVLAKLVDPVTLPPETTRERVRAWTTIKTGR